MYLGDPWPGGSSTHWGEPRTGDLWWPGWENQGLWPPVVRWSCKLEWLGEIWSSGNHPQFGFIEYIYIYIIYYILYIIYFYIILYIIYFYIFILYIIYYILYFFLYFYIIYYIFLYFIIYYILYIIYYILYIIYYIYIYSISLLDRLKWRHEWLVTVVIVGFTTYAGLMVRPMGFDPGLRATFYHLKGVTF